MGIRKLEKRYIKRFRKAEIEEIHNYITNIYDRNDGGYVRIFSSQTGEWLNLTMDSVWDINNFKVALNHIGKEDSMYSLNLFKNHETGLKKDLQAIRILAVDVDFKNKGKHKELTKESIMYLLEEDYFNNEIPVPTVIESGNQIRLIYVLDETVGATNNSKRLADRINKVLSDKLIEFGAEPHKLTSFARFPCSINTKTGDNINVLNYSDYRYTLKELQEDWLNPLPDWYKPYLEKRQEKLNKKSNKETNEEKEKGKVINYFTTYSLNLGRIEDLETIQRFYNFGLENDKEYMCFLYRNHCILSGMSKDEAMEKTKEFYLKFSSANEYKWKKIESQTRNVERHTYFIPNHRILEHLGITAEEEEELELTVTISKGEKRRRDFANRKAARRNQNGLTPKQQELADLKVKVLGLRQQGLSIRKIAEELGKSKGTIENILKK